MSLEPNELIFLSKKDEQKYRQLKINFRDACNRIHELSEFIFKLKETTYLNIPSFLINASPVMEEYYRVTKQDYEFLNKVKKLINEFDL